MDEIKTTHSANAGQGTLWVHRRCDGSWNIIRDEGSVAFIEKLTIVPDRTAVDRFEDALSSARKMSQEGVAAGLADDAFALFDCRLGAALEALREAFKR
jgi:hypothetical protein